MTSPVEIEEENEQQCEEEVPAKLSYSAIMHQKISSMIIKADRALEEGDHARCISILSRAIALAPCNAELFKKRGDAYFQLNDFVSAIANYKRTISLSPSEAAGLAARVADAYYRSGRLFCAESRFEAALEEFSRASEFHPDGREYTMQRILCLLSLKRYEECLVMIQTELEHGLPTPQLYIIHAKISLTFEKNAEVYRSLCRALELDPSHQEAIQMKAQQVTEAKKLWSQAVKFLLLGQRDGAMNKISAAIDCDPDEAEFHVLRGAIHRQTGNYSKAVDELLTAVDKCGGEGRGSRVYTASCRQLVLTYNDFAVQCFRRRNYREAIQLLNKALEDEKTEAGLYVNRGDCFYHLNNLHFALADYSQALQISPADWHVRCRVAVTQCELGVKEFMDGHFSNADDLFSSAIHNNPKVSRFYLCRARARYELKQIDGAREDLLHVLILEPDCDACLPLIARVFPGKQQSDLLTSPEFTTTSAELMKSINKSEKASNRIPIGVSERAGQKMWRELEDLFSQLGLTAEAEETDTHKTAANTTDGDPTDGNTTTDGAVKEDIITPVFSSHDLPATADHTSASFQSTYETNKLTENPGVLMSDKNCDERNGSFTPEPPTLSRLPQRSRDTPPRKWPVLSLPLPPLASLLSPRGKDGVQSVLPDRVACAREEEFHTQLYYSKKDEDRSPVYILIPLLSLITQCTDEVQKEIQRSPSVTSPPHNATIIRPQH